MSITPRVAWNPNANPHDPQITGATFQINNAKLDATVATLSINDNKQGFEITISWNKHRSEKRTQPRNNNLDYLIDPTFKNINRLFACLFKNGNDDLIRNSFDEYYMLFLESKYFSALIDNKPFCDQ